MLRGFRWQLVAFVLAAGLFVVSLLVRSGETPAEPLPTAIPPSAPTSTAVQPVFPPTDSTTAVAQATTPLAPANTSDEIVTYREALIGSVQRLNPLFAGMNPVDRDITSLIFEGLTKTNAYGEPEPALAKSWVVSSDGLEYVVQLRDDVLWQDGIPFSADDVIYTMSLLRAPDFPGPAEVGQFWRTVETEKLGNDLVRFRLTQPLGSFLDALRIGILPFHALAGTTASQLASHPFNLTPIGTGPYQLEALRSADGQTIQQVDLRVAPVYRQRPEGQSGYALERVSFRLYANFDDALTALKNGEVDALAGRSRQERQAILMAGNFHPYTAIEPTLGALIFNWASDQTKYFREQRVRVALDSGLDRSSIVERRLPNEAIRADSPIMPGSWAYDANLPWPSYDPNIARQLLQAVNFQALSAEATPEAGVAATPEATPTSGYLVTFNILVPNDPDLVAMAQEIASQWAQINVGVNVEPVDLETYQSRLDSGQFDAAMVELSLGDSADPDVYAFWHQGQYPDGKNYGGVNDRRISESLERARQDTNGINRTEYYDKFQHDFAERAIAIPLYYPLYTYATSMAVSGIQLGFIGSPSDRFRNIQDWTMSG
jgi:peptide/nickel transport system substrate-binding protein